MADFRRASDVRIDAEREVLHVEWEDGQATEYGFEDLRRRCPCAICAGEGGRRGTMSPTTPLSARESTLEDWWPVGRYGLGLRWADGHDTGIFTFKFLREAAGLTP